MNDQISDQIRRAIDQSGLSMYEVAKRACISPNIVRRFMRGERTITTETLDKIAPVLGLRIVVGT